MTTSQRQADAYQAANREAAAIIMADAAKYPAGSLLATWAALVLQHAAGLENLSPMGDIPLPRGEAITVGANLSPTGDIDREAAA